MALGMTLVIISGGIDLSVGSIMALAGISARTRCGAACRFPRRSQSVSGRVRWRVW